MYENVNPPSTPRHDVKLIIAAVVLLAVLILPVAVHGGHIYRYHNFMGDISESCIASKWGTAAVCTVDGKSEEMTQEKLSQLLMYLMDGGSGGARYRLPKEEPLRIAFADGAVLELWGAQMKDSYTREPIPSLFVSYVNAEGKRFSYITNQISTSTLLGTLPTIALDWIERGRIEQ